MNEPSVAKDRFPALRPDEMSASQRAVADRILSGPRKSLEGPFNSWLRSPELAGRLQAVGEYLRFQTSVPLRLNEFAILVTARIWNAPFEWYAHYPLAIKAGVDPEVAGDLALGLRPGKMTDGEKAVFDFAIELHQTRHVKDATYNAAQRVLGDQGVVDLIALLGYYDLVSMTLQVSQTPAPAGADPALPDLAGRPAFQRR